MAAEEPEVPPTGLPPLAQPYPWEMEYQGRIYVRVQRFIALAEQIGEKLAWWRRYHPECILFDGGPVGPGPYQRLRWIVAYAPKRQT